MHTARRIRVTDLIELLEGKSRSTFFNIHAFFDEYSTRRRQIQKTRDRELNLERQQPAAPTTMQMMCGQCFLDIKSKFTQTLNTSALGILLYIPASWQPQSLDRRRKRQTKYTSTLCTIRRCPPVQMGYCQEQSIHPPRVHQSHDIYIL